MKWIAGQNALNKHLYKICVQYSRNLGFCNKPETSFHFSQKLTNMFYKDLDIFGHQSGILNGKIFV